MFVLTCQHVCVDLLVTGVGRVRGVDQGEELHLGGSGLWKGPD